MQSAGEKMNKLSILLAWILYPIKMIVSRNGFIKYDPLKDTLFIYNMEISRDFFYSLSESDDIKFLVEKNKNNILIKKLKK